MMVLYSGTTCPFSQRCRLVLFEKGMDFEVRDVDLFNKPEDISTMNPKDAKAWFGAVPPDLSVIARAKASGSGSGSDYLYTYLRTFYKDDTRPNGWNNRVLENAAMPHVLWELQGIQKIKMKDVPDPHEHGKTIHQFDGFEQVAPGTMSKLEFDNAVADLVGYMQWMAAVSYTHLTLPTKA